jgi:hypothetical protein
MEDPRAHIAAIGAALAAGRLIPYLGPGLLELQAGAQALPASSEALARMLNAKVTVPLRARSQLSATAQYIENYKHRKTLTGLMSQAFATHWPPTALHLGLAAVAPPLIVDTWYDQVMEAALREGCAAGERGQEREQDWGQVQGLSQTEHFGHWTGAYDASGQPVEDAASEHWRTLLYKPIGGVSPAGNYLVSDTDYVEVLTVIDIQLPIPEPVKRLRSGRDFLFLGCRFNDPLPRTFARQIMKRSGDRHWAVIAGDLSPKEARFLAEQRITRIDLPLAQFVEQLFAQQAFAEHPFAAQATQASAVAAA